MKRFFLIISFFCLLSFPIYQPVFAQTPTPVPDEEVDTRTDWEKFWDSIGNLIASIFTTTQNSGVAKTKYTVSTSDDDSKFTNYNAKDKDSITRSSSQSNLAFKKGTVLKRIIEGTYTDYTIAYLCGNSCSETKNNSDCSDIKYTNLVYHFYKKGQNILYDPSDSKNPIGYDSEKMESYKYTYKSELDSCYRNLYGNMPKIPKGDLQGETNAAPASSKELNDGLRNFIPASSQTSKPAADVSNKENVKALTNDNDLQQRAMFSNFIPAKSQTVLGATSDNVLGISTNTDQLKNVFARYLHPQAWQDKNDYLVERDDYDSNWPGYGGGTSTGTCNALRSHCRGMSQYGALGLSQSGKNYKEILKFYYGSNSETKEIDTANMDIKVNMTDADSCPDGSSLNVEDYLRGLGVCQQNARSAAET
jgi:hypothetical protein